MKERGGLDLSNVQMEFQVTEQPLYLLVTRPGTVEVFLRKQTQSHGSIMGWLPWPCLAVFPELLMRVTFAKMHKALISARLTFTSRNPSVQPTHNRGKLQNPNRHMLIL